jgi:ribosomal protein S18 acetylase RimI-like enzyme
MEVRKYQSKDFDRVCELVQRSVETIDSKYSEEERKHLREVIPDMVAGFAESDDCTYFVAEDEEEVVGTAGLFDGEAEISGIFVDPDDMKQGVGRVLVEKLAEKVEERGSDTLKASASLTADGFYRKLGFQKKEETSLDMEGEEIPVYKMEKKLT